MTIDTVARSKWVGAGHGWDCGGLGAGRGWRRDAGFSLVDMLVALILVALMLAMLPSALQLARRAWDGQAQLDQAQAEDIGLGFIERQLALARPSYRLSGNRKAADVFVGEPSRVAFIAPLPEAAPRPGLYRYTLGLDAPEAVRNAGRTALAVDVVQASAWAQAQSRPHNGTASPAKATRRHDLASDVTSLGLRYFGPPDDEPGGPREATWQAEWRDRASLPDLIEVTVTTGAAAARRQHRIVVAPKMRRRL